MEVLKHAEKKSICKGLKKNHELLRGFLISVFQILIQEKQNNSLNFFNKEYRTLNFEVFQTSAF